MIPRRRLAILLLPSLLLMATACAPQSSSADGPATSQGTIENKGSDTMVNLALAWAEAYQLENPAVRLSVTGGGSGTGIASLINGTVDLANASRRIKPEEISQAQANGVQPVEFVVAQDAIAIVVHRDNPVDRLTLEQISAIYQGLYNNWSEVGGEDRPIVRLSRETNSGTHVYFLEEVLRLGDSESRVLFSRDTLLLPSSEGITAEVHQNPNAIGYDGLGYVTDAVKVVAVADQGSEDYVLPSAESVNNQTYPIARDLYMYTPGDPQGQVAAYLDWILSPPAQQIVVDLGFVPIQ